MPADMQTNHGSSNVHAQWFSHWKIRADDHDVMRISCARDGGTIKGEHDQTSGLSSGYPGTIHLGLLTIHRPSTSAVSVPLEEKSTIRMDSVTCLLLCMYPDLSGELSIIVTLVV